MKDYGTIYEFYHKISCDRMVHGEVLYTEYGNLVDGENMKIKMNEN